MVWRYVSFFAYKTKGYKLLAVAFLSTLPVARWQKKLLIKVRWDIGERVEGVCGLVLSPVGAALVMVGGHLGYDSLLFSRSPRAGGAITILSEREEGN